MIKLIGLGMYGEVPGSLDLSGFEIYVENYTFLVNEELIRDIERATRKTVKIATRSMLEEGVSDFVSMAVDRDIALFVGGDPLIATTHKIIYLEALSKNVRFEVYHSSSVFTYAIGESGLDFYRFGAVCTVAAWRDNYKPLAFYDKMYNNIRLGLHTLLLLDYNSESGKSLNMRDAIDILKKAEDSRKLGFINDDTKIVLMLDLGTKAQRVIFDSVSKIYSDLPSYSMGCIIIPGPLTGLEREILERVCK